MGPPPTWPDGVDDEFVHRTSEQVDAMMTFVLKATEELFKNRLGTTYAATFERTRDTRLVGSVGTTNAFSRVLRVSFSSVLMSCMPMNQILLTVIHELAHARVYVDAWDGNPDPDVSEDGHTDRWKTYNIELGGDGNPTHDGSRWLPVEITQHQFGFTCSDAVHPCVYYADASSDTCRLVRRCILKRIKIGAAIGCPVHKLPIRLMPRRFQDGTELTLEETEGALCAEVEEKSM